MAKQGQLVLMDGELVARLEALRKRRELVIFYCEAKSSTSSPAYGQELVSGLVEAAEEFDKADVKDQVLLAKLQERRSVLKQALADFNNCEAELQYLDGEILKINGQLDERRKEKEERKPAFVPKDVAAQHEEKRDA